MKHGSLLSRLQSHIPALGWIASLFVILLMASPAAGQLRPPEVCTPTNCLPPADKTYKENKDNPNKRHHQKYGDGIGEVKNGYHKRFTTWGVPPEPGFPPLLHSFGSVVGGLLSLDGGTNYTEFEFPAQVTVMVVFDHFEGSTSVYRTEMTELNVTGTGPAVMIRESPTLASAGETTIRPIPGGYAISSFFDVFTELSLDGGATWLPSMDNGMPLAGRMDLSNDDAAPLVTPLGDVAPIPDQPYCQPTNWNTTVFEPNGVKVRDFKHRQLHNPVSLNIPVGQGTIYTANNTLIEADVSPGIGQPFQRIAAQANMAVRVTHTVDANGGRSRFFDTEMQQLNISGGTLPPGVMLRESPTKASRGAHTVRSTQGTFLVNSFFDVFLELSVDGGQVWTPASGPVRMEIPSSPPLAAIPTLSEWGLIILALLLLTFGTVFILRRRATTPARVAAAS